MRRPNPIAKALAMAAASEELPLPVLRLADLMTLEALFPQRCLRPKETVEDHLRYAGVATLVVNLRAVYDNATQNDAAAAESLEDGERAR